MKKVLLISGVITVFLLVFLLTGMADADDAEKKALSQGNRQYESSEYTEALSSYETGLSANPESEPLSFNAAQAAYLLGDYEKAAEYYDKSEDSIEKFLNAGNIYFKMGDAAQDENQKAELYAKALEIYFTGITKYPQDVPLKYNYEAVKEKIEELSNDQEQENQDQEQDSEKDESSEDNQGDNQDQESEQQDSEQQDNEQQDSEQQDSEQQDSEQQDNEQQEDEEQEAYSQEDNGEETEQADAEAIEHILRMLEMQEEESLKNNQEIVGGSEGKNGW